MSDRAVLRQASVCLGWMAIAGAGTLAAATDTVGMQVLLGGIVGGIGVNVASTSVQGFFDRFWKRDADRDLGRALDHNHDEAQALRKAQLAGLRNLFDELRALPDHEGLSDFVRRGQGWLKAELEKAARNDLADESARQAALSDAVPGILAQKAGGQAKIDLRQAAENAVLAELALQLGDVPQTFADRFRDDNGWYVRFGIEAAAQIKNDPKMQAIWMAMRIALLAESADRIEDKLDQVLARFAQIDEAIFGRTPFILSLETLKSTTAQTHFSYLNPSIPFLGRRQELRELDEFLDSPAKFSWHMIAAGGGAGKSRLAYELCRRRAGGWRAGFVRGDANAALTAGDLEQWRPKKPHLIVIDYVLANAKIAQILLAASAAQAKFFDHAVRILLIERADDAFQQSQVWGGGDSRHAIQDARWPVPALALGELSADDTFSLARPFLGARTIGESEFSALHRQIDPDRRVLTGLILAELLGEGNAPAKNLHELFSHLLDRERAKYWRTAKIRDDVEEPLLALATMTDGYSPERDATGLPEPLIRALETAAGAEGYKAAQHYTGCSESDPTIRRVLPDLLGEYFVLEMLGAVSPATRRPSFPWLAPAAWRTAHGRAMFDFVMRARRDFPDHPAIAEVIKPVSGVPESYFVRALHSQKFAGDFDGFIKMAFNTLAAETDSSARIAEADLLLMVTALPDGSRLSARISDAMNTVTAAAQQPDAGDRLLVAWAKIVTNFIADTAAQDPKTARGLLQTLDARAFAPGADPQLAVAWAQSVKNFIANTAAQDIETARGLLQTLDARAFAPGADPQLAVQWAQSVTNFIGKTAAQDIETARGLLQTLDARAFASGADPQLAVAWAESVTNFIAHTAAQDIKTARGLFQMLDARAFASGADPQLAIEWAKSVFNLITDSAARDIKTARGLLQTLDAHAFAPRADPQLAVHWAKSVTNFIGHTAAKDSKTSRGLLQTLDARAFAPGADPQLAVEWAKGALIVVLAGEQSALSDDNHKILDRAYDVLDLHLQSSDAVTEADKRAHAVLGQILGLPVIDLPAIEAVLSDPNGRRMIDDALEDNGHSGGLASLSPNQQREAARQFLELVGRSPTQQKP